MIRRFTIVLCLIMFSIAAKAQQDPYYSQFMLNKIAYNPGAAGFKNSICANILAHRQWTGLTNEDELQFNPNTVGRQPIGPTTYFASISAPVSILHGGAGFTIMSDVVGYERTINVKASYAYHHEFKNYSRIQVGFDIGMLQKEFDGSFYNPRQQNDPLIPNGTTSGRIFDLGFGAYYNNPALANLEVGVSATHLVEGSVNYDVIDVATGAIGIRNSEVVRNIYIVASTAHPISPSIILQPNIWIKTIFTTTQVDLNCRALINQTYVVGLSYRDGGRTTLLDAMALQLGYYIQPDFYLGYSYDIPTTRGLAGGGTHEIFASYCFKINKPEKVDKWRIDPRHLGGYR